MYMHLTTKSRNIKTGPMPVTTTSRVTCPDACPFKDDGCYADGGPLRLFWDKVTSGEAGKPFDAACDDIAALPDGTLWRHDQAGDLPGVGNDIDRPKLERLTAANGGKRGFTYTHKPLTPANAAAIAAANDAGFTINLSANNPAHADTLADSGVGPVVTVLALEYQRRNDRAGWAETMTEYRDRLATLPQTTPGGRRIAVCPATYRDDVSCMTCQLCQRRGRGVIVGFPAHGVSKRRVNAIASSD